jgi:hypothetical protein
LNKTQQGIIRTTTQYADRSPIEPECVLSKWQNYCGVVVRKNARLCGPGMMFHKTCKKHYGGSSKNITFSILSKEKMAKML